MATEYQSIKYYNHDHYVPIHDIACIAIEQFLSEVAFHKDASRIVYSTEDIVFRRRIEMADIKGGFDNSESINITNLNLPFASYYQSENWTEDDRDFTTQASEMVIGYYDQKTFTNLRCMAVKSNYDITAFFARFDDARQFYELMLWEKNPFHPIWLYGVFEWYGVQLLVPCFTTIEKIELNPGYKESDWLTKSRIIPVKMSCTVRSFSVLVDQIAQQILPYKFQQKNRIANVPWYEANLTEKVTLHFFNEKQWIQEPSFSEKREILIKSLVEAYEDVVSDGAKNLFESPPEDTNVPSYTKDILGSYFTNQVGVHFDSIQIIDPTSTSLTIEFKFKKPEEVDNFVKMVIIIQGRDDSIIEEFENKVVIKDLHNNSNYHMIIMVYGKDGSIVPYRVSGTTLDAPDNKAPTTETKERYPQLPVSTNKLKGMTF